MSDRILEATDLYDSPEEVGAFDQVVDRHWLIAHSRFLRRTLQHTPPGATILDVGGGTGQQAVALASDSRTRRVAILDVSSVMLQVAEAKALQAGVASKLQFIKADAEAGVPLPDNSFDVVMCYNTLHHFTNPLAVVAEMQRVVKPTGSIFIRDIIRPGPRVLKLLSKIPLSVNATLAKQSLDSLRAALSWEELQAIQYQLDPDSAPRRNLLYANLQKLPTPLGSHHAA